MNPAETKDRKQRKIGIDLLRIVSMLFVVALHILGGGGMLASASGNAMKYEQLKLLHIAAMCAVNCYGIISGYVGVSSKFRLSNVITLWLQVFLYSACIGMFAHILRPDLVPIETVLKLCLPVLNKSYWYFTSYFPLMFAMPLLNSTIEHTPRKVFEISFGCLLILLTFGQQVFYGNDVFRVTDGYSFLWLAVLYCIGGYLRKYHSSHTKKSIWMLVYVACVIACWGIQFVMRRLDVKNPTRWEVYNSPIILLMGISLVLIFANLNLSAWMKKVVAFLSPAAFGVYLIHMHPLIREHLLDYSFVQFAAWPTWTMLPLAITFALAIYLICSGVDLIRHYLFAVLKIKKRLSKLDTIILSDGGNT